MFYPCNDKIRFIDKEIEELLTLAPQKELALMRLLVFSSR
jgi:hypothetical protein